MVPIRLDTSDASGNEIYLIGNLRRVHLIDMSAALDDVQGLHRKRRDLNLKCYVSSIPNQCTNVPEQKKRMVRWIAI